MFIVSVVVTRREKDSLRRERTKERERERERVWKSERKVIKFMICIVFSQLKMWYVTIAIEIFTIIKNILLQRGREIEKENVRNREKWLGGKKIYRIREENREREGESIAIGENRNFRVDCAIFRRLLWFWRSLSKQNFITKM